MGCRTCREKRLHKQITHKGILLHRYISVSLVLAVLKTNQVSYTLTRSSGVPFVKVCMCELNRSILTELQNLKENNKGLPIIYT
jgi:hypothetical protein